MLALSKVTLIPEVTSDFGQVMALFHYETLPCISLKHL